MDNPRPMGILTSMKPTLRQPVNWNHLWQQQWKLFVATVGAMVFAIALSLTGVLQIPELAMLDHFFRWRPLENPDSRIAVVTIGDEDISLVGAWPIPDRVLANTLKTLKAQRPRAIGLDLYRDLPVEPGYQDLVEVFQSTPEIIGGYKRFGLHQVPPPPVLAKLNQTAIFDAVEDVDGRVRRMLLTAIAEDGQSHVSLAAKTALMYLGAHGITPKAGENVSDPIQLGLATIKAFREHDGGYVRADDNGYQILLNFRGAQDRFRTTSLTSVLKGEIPKDFAHDRIVFIGSTAESTNDFFLSPYNDGNTTQFSRMPGVYVHANSASQLLSAALDGRALIQVVPDPIEWLWVIAWALLGAVVRWHIFGNNQFNQVVVYVQTTLLVVFFGASILLVSYVGFLNGWWIPCIAPMIALVGTTIACNFFQDQNFQRLAYLDELTRVPNRRYFDLQLARQIKGKGYLSLILCDVDFFKLYNDTYGHQAGDECLQLVASAIRRAVRRTDVVARYGGEEFAVILPQTGSLAATQAAQRIVNQVREMKLPHRNSGAQNYVTLSCGVVTLKLDSDHWKSVSYTAMSLIAKADEALYASKREGRDRFTFATYPET